MILPRAWLAVLVLPLCALSAYGLSEEARAILLRKQYEAAYKLILREAKAGDAEAQFSLGRMYLNAWGVEKDMFTAVRWIKRSAKQFYLPAMSTIAGFYARGWLVQKDYLEGCKWLQLAILADHKRARENAIARYRELGKPWADACLEAEKRVAAILKDPEQLERFEKATEDYKESRRKRGLDP